MSTAIPLQGMDILVDTNVWYWVANPFLYNPPPHGRAYPHFIQMAKNAGSRLHACELSIAELAHVIERERMLWRNSLTNNRFRSLKDFRGDAAERKDTVDELEMTSAQIHSMADDLPGELNRHLGSAAMSRLRTEPLDGPDAFLIEIAHRSGITRILTNDRDFIYVPGLMVITDNPTSIDKARRARKLVPLS
jgi:predicted nucleic acid-binding protein